MSPDTLLGVALTMPALGALLVLATGRLPNLRDSLSPLVSLATSFR